MGSATDAIEKVVFDLLSAGGDLGASVFQHVPEDTPPPVVIIGDMESVPFGAKDDPDERVSLAIITVIDGEERKPMLAIQDRIKTRLSGARATPAGWVLGFSFISANAVLTPEGDGYVGESRFEVLALSA